MNRLMMFLSLFFFVTNSCSIINNLKAVNSVLNTDTFSSNEAILPSSNMFAFSGICFNLILTTEGVSQVNGGDLSEMLVWMCLYRNVWSLVIFSILLFAIRNDNLLSIISAVTSELFNYLCKYSYIEDP